jgi:hypothetical protein
VGALAVSDGGGGGNDLPQVSNVELRGQIQPQRLDDPTRVTILFRLTEADGDAVTVTVVFSTPESDSGEIVEGEFAASSVGVDHRVEWDATASGISRETRVSISITPRDSDGEGAPALRTGVLVGNNPPRVDSVEVVRDEGAPASGNVVVRHTLSDSAATWLPFRFWYERPTGLSRFPRLRLSVGNARTSRARRRGDWI